MWFQIGGGGGGGGGGWGVGVVMGWDLIPKAIRFINTLRVQQKTALEFQWRITHNSNNYNQLNISRPLNKTQSENYTTL